MNFDITNAASRIKVGLVLITWGLIVSTISFYRIDFNIESGVVNTVFMMGSGLLGLGLFKKKE